LKHKDLNIEYNCYWNNNNIGCINYIYPGNYDIIVYYAGKEIYKNQITLNKDTIDTSTKYIINCNIDFKTIKCNVYNEQTGKHIIYC
jgi:hypothetical protein